MNSSSAVLLALLGGSLLSGCNLAPAYTQPHFVLPETYQGSEPFQVAQPDAEFSPAGDWWTLFKDPELDRFEDQLTRANPTLQVAMEQYAQARDLAAEAQSQFYPQLAVGGALSDNRQSVERLFRGSTTTRNVEASNEVLASASWEPDFWGQVRNLAHENKRLAQASAADLAAARLSLQAELATDYLAVRGLDKELQVLRQAIAAYQKAVEVTSLRYHGGITSGLDLARAASQLGAAQALMSEVGLQRDLLQHAVAVLVGAIPGSFSLPVAEEFRPVPPLLPVGLPSELLQRRPDIASAERHMAAANASIGVSRAAFYPHVMIPGAAGFQASGFDIFNLPNSLWSIGADAMLPLFQGGLRRAELQQSWSQYAQTRDNYRATVLAAFQEVEDGLSLTQRLKSEVIQEHEASDQAAQALWISTKLYNAGLDNYLSVAVSQVQALTAHTSEVQAQIRQMQAAVLLIRALGGGWTVQSLPSERQTLPFGPLDYHVQNDTDPALQR
jgi:NodT family efflux transporter outer membrane factor (OMF) lipoprotein